MPTDDEASELSKIDHTGRGPRTTPDAAEDGVKCLVPNRPGRSTEFPQPCTHLTVSHGSSGAVFAATTAGPYWYWQASVQDSGPRVPIGSEVPSARTQLQSLTFWSWSPSGRDEANPLCTQYAKTLMGRPISVEGFVGGRGVSATAQCQPLPTGAVHYRCAAGGEQCSRLVDQPRVAARRAYLPE
jgi:hypothetical protein